MQYIVFDLEFNQDLTALPPHPFEIIQIGAIKLDMNLQTVSTFERYIKPTVYSKVSPFITELTGITTEQLLTEQNFPVCLYEFIDFIGDCESIFCTWGIADIKEIFRSIEYHGLTHKQFSRLYINIQPFLSLHLNPPQKNLLKLQFAVESLGIPLTVDFHNALNDAYYTAEVFKKVYNSSIEPKVYNPTPVLIQTRQRKKRIDEVGLFQQFEKMLARELNLEEKELILLAFKMGKTNQFLI